jgi:hypothetical protein
MPWCELLSSPLRGTRTKAGPWTGVQCIVEGSRRVTTGGTSTCGR